MSKKAYIVTGLGYGDEGKGSIVDWLTLHHSAHTVIRTGGPQALHRVVTSDGREHVFSQFGSGTFRGAATHLSRNMLVAPSALLREGTMLQQVCGRDVFAQITLHSDALLVTPFQAVAGRVRELLRGNNRRGSVGVGVGETVRDSEAECELVLRARDLTSSNLAEKLTELCRYKWRQYESYADRASGLTEPMGTIIRAQLAQIEYGTLLEQTIAEFTELSNRVRIVDDTYVAEKILAPPGIIICEGSQGVLLDRVHGFYPYTTKVRSTPTTARELLDIGGYDGSIQSLGILRSYATRHGYGPFVTEDSSLTTDQPDAKNKNDAWQGNFRIGHFDGVASKYAATVCGPAAFDGLVLTCLDRTNRQATWSACTAYELGHTGTKIDTTSLQNKDRHELSQTLSQCQPVLEKIEKRDLGESKFQERQTEIISSLVGIPVYAISMGETEAEKQLYRS